MCTQGDRTLQHRWGLHFLHHGTVEPKGAAQPDVVRAQVHIDQDPDHDNDTGAELGMGVGSSPDFCTQ